MATERKILTDFLQHPHRDSHRLELLDGEIYQKAPLPPDHLSLARKLGATLDEFGFAGVEARILMDSVAGWRPSSPIPDVVFFKAKPLIRGDWPKSPPDIVAEILAPRRNRLVMRARVEAYLAAGAGAVWVIDIERHCVEVYGRDSHRTAVGAERMTSRALPGLAVPVSTLFLDLDRKSLAGAA